MWVIVKTVPFGVTSKSVNVSELVNCGTQLLFLNLYKVVSFPIQTQFDESTAIDVEALGIKGEFDRL